MKLINGCLLEGIDYAGKTSVARELIKQLKKEGIRCKYNKDYLIRETPAAKKFITCGDNVPPPNILQDLYYLITKMIESICYKAEKNIFVIQDRYLFSTLNHCSFFYLDKNRDLLKLYNEGLHFKKNVYLTSSITTKMDRFIKNPPTNSFDKFLYNHKKICQAYDDFCLKNVPVTKDWIIINTDNLSIRQIRNKVLRFVKE